MKYYLINLAVKNKISLEYWIRGVSIILEKSLGNINTEKLRAILHLEASFNVLHKIIFNNRLEPILEVDKAIPQKIIDSRRS